MLKILFLTGEVTPFSRTGKQGDLAAALAKSLKRVGHEVRVVTPRYEMIRERKHGLRDVTRLKDLEIDIGDSKHVASAKSGFIPSSKVQVYFVEHPVFANSHSLISESSDTDSHFASALLIHSGLQLVSLLNWIPDIIYCCGWTMGLAPHLIRNQAEYQHNFAHSRITLHLFDDEQEVAIPTAMLPQLGLKPGKSNHVTDIGKQAADLVIGPKGTVSEWLEYLSHNQPDSPEPDSELEQHHISPKTTNGALKAEHKEALQKRLGLPIDSELPLVMLWSGGAHIEQTLNLLEAELPGLEAQIVALSSDESGHSIAERWAERLTDKAAALNGTLVDSLHRIESAADILLIPQSNTTEAMRPLFGLSCGAVPVVNESAFSGAVVEGLLPEGMRDAGFLFRSDDGRSMLEALRSATTAFRNPTIWSEIRRRGLNHDLCYEQAARNMTAAFHGLLERPVRDA